MADPITLSVVGSVALTEGIRFLYSQAGEILKRCRERRQVSSIEELAPTETTHAVLPAVFEGQLKNPTIHFDVIQEVEGQLRALRRELSDYLDGIEAIDPSNDALMHRVDALRQVLEVVYQQHLTFRGEQRPSSRPVVEGFIEVNRVLGRVAAVRAKEVAAGTIRAAVKADHVESGAEVVGVEIEGTLGPLK